MDTNNIIVGLDIGTTKICAIIARKDAEGRTEVLGYGKAPSLGVARGEVANIDKTVDAIRQAAAEAEEQAGVPIRDVYVGIAGQHIKSMQHRGIHTRGNVNEEIGEDDVRTLIRDMYSLAMNPGERIIHVLPQEFIVDTELDIKDPVGMFGNRLEANFHIITGKVSAAQNIRRCVDKAELDFRDMVLEPLASAASVLDENEKEAGVALVDMGGGTTDIAIFQDGIIRHTCVIPFGGNIVTKDIKEGCRIMHNQAERLKTEFGSALAYEAKSNQIISIPGLRGRSAKEISVQNLANIIQARLEEIFEQVLFEIKASGYASKLIGGVVLTGGGSQMRNMKQLVEYVTGMDCRIGHPIEHLAPDYDDALRHPMYATGLGLVEYVWNRADEMLGEEKPGHQAEAGRGVRPDATDADTTEVEAEEEETVVEKARRNPLTQWWDDMRRTIPDFLLDQDLTNDFED